MLADWQKLAITIFYMLQHQDVLVLGRKLTLEVSLPTYDFYWHDLTSANSRMVHTLTPPVSLSSFCMHRIHSLMLNDSEMVHETFLTHTCMGGFCNSVSLSTLIS